MSEPLKRISGANPHRFIAGRAGELEVFRGAFNRMLAGRLQMVLISGEPGIGKTRCAEALAEVAEDQGALVLWGRCHEEAGAPPYWPWVQILRSYVEASSIDEVRFSLGSAAQDIAAFVPELVDSSHRPREAPGAIVEANRERFRTFDAIRQFLHQATQQVPITLVLDNLHWADPPSLSLLEFLSQELMHSRLLIVGTHRNIDASRKSPLLDTLGGLSRDSNVQRVHLSGLSQTSIGEVAQHLCGVNLSETVLKMIYQRTDGNPLFAIELIKVLIDESAGAEITAMPNRIPAGVHETIGRRLIRLSAQCNELLCVAAVHGRQFAAREIAATLAQDVPQVLRGLEPAVEAGIIQPLTTVSASYQFTHALIRETIYEDLPTVDRLKLHERAGDALASIHFSLPESALTRIAHHYHEAATLGDSAKAVVFALRAAESAIWIGAYEDAIVHYDHVIEALERAGLRDDERVARAYILKGSALRQMGQVRQSIEVLLDAVNRTQALGSAELLVDVLVYLAMVTRHIDQQHFVPLIQRALALLPEADSALRAKALATLAFAKRTLTAKSQVQLLVDESLAMAGRCCDATARSACYQFGIMALRGDPDTLNRRLQLGQDNIAVALSTGSADLLADAYHWQALNYFESGQLEHLNDLLDRYDSINVGRLGLSSLHQYQAGAHRVTLALLRGDWKNLENRIEGLLELGMKTRREDAAGVNGAHMFALNRDLGHLHALAPEVKRIAAGSSSRIWEPGLMLLCAEIGMLAEARRLFERIADQNFRSIRRDDMYVTCLVFCAETCYILEDANRAAILYELLQPYEGQTANHPTAVSFGAAELYLGMLARAAKWPELAQRHFDRALALNRAMLAWPSLARTLFRYGAFLKTSAVEAERQLGLQRLREAEQLSRRLGMTRLITDIDALLHTSDRGATFPDDLTAREMDVLRLLAIGRSNKDVSLVLAISLNTVATHVRSILNKTQCANRTEAAAYAIRLGLQRAESSSIAL